MTQMVLNEQEVALLILIRSMRHGTIEALAVKDGRPSVVKNVIQRIDLTLEHERALVIGGDLGLVLADVRGSVPIDVEPV